MTPSHSGEEQQPAQKLPGLLVPILLAMVFVTLRLLLLGESAYYDEVWTLEYMGEPTFVEFWELERTSDPTAPLVPIYYSMLYLWGQLVAPGVLAARIFSLIFSCLSAFALYALSRKLMGVTTARWSLGLYSISLVHIFYAVEIRMYSMTLLLVLLSVLTFFKVLESPSPKRWGLHIFINVLLTFTHVIATLLFVAQWCFLIWKYRKNVHMILQWTSAHLALLVTLILWAMWIWPNDVTEVAPSILPSVRDLANAFVVYAGGRPTNLAIAEHLPFGISFDVMILGIMAGLGLFSLIVAQREPDDNDFTINVVRFMVIWAVLPVAIAFVVSHIITPIFLYRYLLYCSLPIIMLASYGISRIPLRAVKYAVGMLLVLLQTYQLQVLREPIRPDYAAIVEYIQEHGEPDDQIYACKTYNAGSITFNSNLPSDNVVTIHDWDQLIDETLAAKTDNKSIWILFWRWGNLKAFESVLDDENLEYGAQTFGGLPRMSMYHIRTKSGLKQIK